MSNPKLAWTPRLDGDTYCSPACGCGCTKAKYDSAVAAADKICEELGSDWEPIVHENCGWHYRVKHKTEDITVYSRGSYYDCYYNGPVQKNSSGSTPTEAVTNTINLMARLRDEIASSLMSMVQKEIIDEAKHKTRLAIEMLNDAMNGKILDETGNRGGDGLNFWCDTVAPVPPEMYEIRANVRVALDILQEALQAKRIEK